MIKSETIPEWHAVQYGGYWNIQDTPFYDLHRNVLDEEDFPKLAEHHAKIMAKTPQIVCCLIDYVMAQSRMLERYADGDDAVKKELWQNLHSLELPARELLEGLGILPMSKDFIFYEEKVMP